MTLRTESRYALVLLASCVSLFGLLGLLVEKYQPKSLSRMADMCSQLAVSLSLTTFNYTGRVIGISLLMITVLLIVKIAFSIVKTYQKSHYILNMPRMKLGTQLRNLCNKVGVHEQDLIVIQDSRSIAITIGFFCRKIVISSGLLKKLTPMQLQAVVLHEKHHFTHRHPVLFCIGEVIGQSLSFLPVIKEVGEYFKYQLEQEADASVVAHQRTNRYILQSLKVLHQGTNLAIFPAFASPATRANRSFITVKSVGVSVSVLTFLLSLIFLPISVQAQPVHDSGQLQNCTAISRQDCTTYCQSMNFSFVDFKNLRSINTHR